MCSVHCLSQDMCSYSVHVDDSPDRDKSQYSDKTCKQYIAKLHMCRLPSSAYSCPNAVETAHGIELQASSVLTGATVNVQSPHLLDLQLYLHAQQVTPITITPTILTAILTEAAQLLIPCWHGAPNNSCK